MVKAILKGRILSSFWGTTLWAEVDRPLWQAVILDTWSYATTKLKAKEMLKGMVVLDRPTRNEAVKVCDAKSVVYDN